MYCIAVPEMDDSSFQASAKRTLSLRILQQAEMKRFLRLRMAEIQPVGAETDLLPGASLFAGRVIFGVADDGAAYVCKLYPDLVMPSGIQPDIQLGSICAGFIVTGVVAVPGGYDGIAQPGKPGVFVRRGADAGKIRTRILSDIMLQDIFRLRRAAFDKGAVIFAKALAGELPVQFPGGEGRLCKDQDSGYRLV